MERIRPVMTVNKLDRCFLELMLDGEEAYNGFRRTIESANVIMATYADELLGDTQARLHCCSAGDSEERSPDRLVVLPHSSFGSPASPSLCLRLGLGCAQVYPEKGTVSFSAGLHGWAFTLTVFANLYAKKFGVEVSSPLHQVASLVYHTCRNGQCAAPSSRVRGSAALLGVDVQC